MEFKDTFFSRNLSINCRGKLLDLTVPRIMGILNLTPDSFYDGGKYNDREAIGKRIRQIVDEGADIIDIGGFSSRPGSLGVSEEQELKRLLPAIKIIREEFSDFPVSVDTFRAGIVKKLHEEFGIDMINDITGGEGDPDLPLYAGSQGIPYIIMHMQGSPGNMQDKPVYVDIVNDLLDYFDRRIRAMKETGIRDIIIDPGFGFGKSLDHNYELLSGLEVFRTFELPVLVGLSRKSMIYKLLEIKPEEALSGSSALHMYSLQKGAKMLRVHDVKEAAEIVRLYEKLFIEEKKH